MAIEENTGEENTMAVAPTRDMANDLASASYHDVVVYVDGTAYRIGDRFGLLLTCTRSGGWELWADVDADQKPNGVTSHEQKLIGGEYSGHDFRVEVAGVVICQSKWREVQED